jgi:hypothetical protein
MRHKPPPLTKARNTSLVNLESWSTVSASGKPSPDRRHKSRMIAAASAAVAVERVGTACTLPVRRSTTTRRGSESCIKPSRRSRAAYQFAAEPLSLRLDSRGHCTAGTSCVPSKWVNSRMLAAFSSFPSNGRNSLAAAPIRYQTEVLDGVWTLDHTGFQACLPLCGLTSILSALGF